MYDCRGDRIGQTTLGKDRIIGPSLYVEMEYEKAKKDVHDTMPAFGAEVDMRNLEMLKAGCCPRQLLVKEIE